MAEEAGGSRLPLNQTRQVTVDALCEHFANDVMSVEEFERRVEVAHKAATVEDLKELLKDLPGAGVPAVREGQQTPAPAPTPRYTVTSAAHVKEREFMVAAMGGSTRKGHWSPARNNYAVAIMGGTELDFREAQLGPGVTNVQVFTIMGGVDIIVPPGLNVESHGIGILGGFDHRTDIAPGDPNAPTLRITGVACMGGVDITVRHPGESARDARRRRRLERKERKRLHRGD
jgi:hypothetical protein